MIQLKFKPNANKNKDQKCTCALNDCLVRETRCLITSKLGFELVFSKCRHC